MFLMMVFYQMPGEAPTQFYVLSWLALGAMVAALVYVFRAWQADKKNCTDRYKSTIDRLLVALHDQLDDDNDIDINDVKKP